MILAELAHAALTGDPGTALHLLSTHAGVLPASSALPGDPGSALDVLAQQTPPPKKPSDVNTEGILGFLASRLAPILLAVLGLIFIGRANKGEVSRVLTSSAIAIVGVGFIAGAVTLVFLGEYLIGLLFK